jgi:Recombination endonuclease VII
MGGVVTFTTTWQHDAVTIIRAVCLKKEFFTTDDVWEAGLAPPPEPRALGSAMTWAASEGYCVRTPIHVQTQRRARHGAPIAIWLSKLYDNLEARRAPTPLTNDEYDTLLLRQNGVCAVCKDRGRACSTRPLIVDYNPITARVRGLLCGKCDGIRASVEGTKWIERFQTYSLR